MSALLAGQPAMAQTGSPRGWPEASPPATVEPTPTPIKAVAAKVKPAPVVVRPESRKPAAASLEATKATVVETAAPWSEILQQQSALLSQLTTAIEAQRATMAVQQQKIDALEARSLAAAVVPPVVAVPPAAPAMPLPPPPPPPPPPITVETSGIKLRMGGCSRAGFPRATALSSTRFGCGGPS